MRAIAVLMLASVVLLVVATPVRGSVTTNYYHESANDVATISYTHRFWVDVVATNPNNPPTAMVIDYLITQDDQHDPGGSGWGNFQVRTAWSYSWSHPFLTPTVEILEYQWLRLAIGHFPTDGSINWHFPVRFEVSENVTVTRTNAIQGFNDDLASIPGDYFTSLTDNVTAPDTVSRYAEHAFDNPIGIGGRYGAVQRLQSFLQVFYPGDCTPMSMMCAAGMRCGLGVPTPIATAYIVGGPAFNIPTGGGAGYRFTPTEDGHTGHCIIGGWKENDVCIAFDTNNRYSGFTPLNLVMKGGLFEDPVDASYDVYVWGGAAVSLSSDYQWSNTSMSGTNNFSWSITKTHSEPLGSGSYELFTQKTSAGYKPAPPATVGVEDPPPERRKTPMSIFCLGGHPAPRGGGVYVEIAAPEHGVVASLKLYDINGRWVNRDTFGFDSLHVAQGMTIGGQLPNTAGVYIARLTFDGKTVDTEKLVVLQ